LVKFFIKRPNFIYLTHVLTMEKRVELEMRGKTPSEVHELNLDNCRATQVAGITDEFTDLELLSMINVGLTSLKGFPNLSNLKRLELSDNRLTGGLEHLSGCPNVTHLNLSGNKIKDVDTLEPLKNLKKTQNFGSFQLRSNVAGRLSRKSFRTTSSFEIFGRFR